MRFTPAAQIVAAMGTLFVAACNTPSVISDPSGGGGARGDASIFNSDSSLPGFRLDVLVNPNRPPGSDAPPGPGCGNGELSKDEACDDGNTKSGDGCAGNCLSVEPGFSCVKAGKPCRPIARCGDGLVVFPEQCDDGGKVDKDGKKDGDGCSASCRIEVGWKCSGDPSACSASKCGDGKVDVPEGCDDGNTMPFDGCSSECQNEPVCKGGGACTSRCGDGIKMGDEECDDGNNLDDDGCSSSCKVEAGFKCTQAALGDKMLVPVVYRDFKFHNPADFEPGVIGSATASVGIVKDDLDDDGKPVFTGINGGAIQIGVQDKESFSKWYRNTDGVNHATPSRLVLYSNKQGAYVNRYGANGEQWLTLEPAYSCGTEQDAQTDANGVKIPCTFKYGTTECDTKKALNMEMHKCVNTNGSYSAWFIKSKSDGNPAFFPVDGDSFTDAKELTASKLPPPYAINWPEDKDANGNIIKHNFSFTSEVRYWFKYEAGKTYKLDFVGDDDVWVFVNKKLAVDLGGIHMPVPGSVTIDATSAGKYGIADGKVYEMVVFQAERQTTSSTYQLTLSGFNVAPSVCKPECGDGILSIGEECDDGAYNGAGGYGACNKSCTLGSFCGDGVRQLEEGEDCDDGGLNGTLGHCPSGCRILIIN